MTRLLVLLLTAVAAGVATTLLPADARPFCCCLCVRSSSACQRLTVCHRQACLVQRSCWALAGRSCSTAEQDGRDHHWMTRWVCYKVQGLWLASFRDLVLLKFVVLWLAMSCGCF
jgi:hypothetical protein